MQKRVLGFICVTCSSCVHLTDMGALLSKPQMGAQHTPAAHHRGGLAHALHLALDTAAQE